MTRTEALSNMGAAVVSGEGGASESRGILVGCCERWAYVSFGGGVPRSSRYEDIEFCMPAPTGLDVAWLRANGIAVSA